MFFRLVGVALFGVTLAVSAADGVSNDVSEKIGSSLAVALPRLEITTIEKSSIDGLYEVSSKSDQPLLVSADGKYIVAGEIYQINGTEINNISEQKRESARTSVMASIPDSERMSFIPEGPTKAKITVFTDIDCGYCRKLHKEIPQLNAMGIRVDYLGYPRAGVGSSSYNKIVSAWCSEDPQGAMTKAKNGEVIPTKRCANPVAKHMSIGQQVGVNGTPAIVLDSGKLLPGYAPADALAKELNVM